jgi:hypothetical protein
MPARYGNAVLFSYLRVVANVHPNNDRTPQHNVEKTAIFTEHLFQDVGDPNEGEI